MNETEVGERGERKDPHQKQQNAVQAEKGKKCYPLQKLIHALKNCGPHVQETEKSCTAINFEKETL